MPSKTKQVKLRNQIAATSLRATKWAAGILPRWFVQPIMEGLFFLACLGLIKLKQICMTNLLSVYGKVKKESELKMMATQCIKNIGRAMMDILYYIGRAEEFSNTVSINNEKHIKDALSFGKGVIVVTAHLGNFPLMFMALTLKGYKVNVIIRPMRDGTFGDFMFHLSSLANINMIQTSPSKKFLKDSLNALKRNELLFILCDEVVPKEVGVAVKFFNRKVNRTLGPMLFHQRTQSPIVPMFIVKDKQKKFKIYIEKAITIEDKFGLDQNKQANIAHLNTIIESFVRKYPIQWGGWLNKRWISK